MSWKENLVEKPPIFNFKKKDNLYLNFLDEGTPIPIKNIINKDGSVSTIKDSIEFKVINNANQKEGLFYVNSIRLKIALRDVVKTLKGNLLHIKHIVDDDDETNNTYEVKVVKLKPPK